MIHPAYDISTRSWFVDYLGKEYEAPTIRQLIEVIPKRVHVRDYHPNGNPLLPKDITVPKWMTGSKAPEKLTAATRRKKLPQQPPVVETRPEPPMGRLEPLYAPGPIRDEAIMVLWPTHSAREIARSLRITANSVISVVQKMRKQKDPRAARSTEVRWLTPRLNDSAAQT